MSVNLEACSLYDFPQETGVIGDLIGSSKWSSTALGPRQYWPQSLCTTLNMILSSSFPMCILWGKNLNLIYNEAYQAIIGLKHPMAMGKSISEVWPEAWTFHQPNFDRVMVHGETLHFEDQLLPLVRQSRCEDAYFTLSYSPIRSENDQIGGTLLILQETTRYFVAAQKNRESEIAECKKGQAALLQSEAIYRAIGDSLDYGVWIAEADGRNTYVSESFLKLLGITQNQFSEFRYGAYLHSDDPSGEVVEMMKEGSSTVKFWESERCYKSVDGQWHSILSRGVPIRNESGTIIRWAGINLDISKMKQTEQQLQNAVTVRNDFVSIASHELKTPLTALHLQLQMLERKAKSTSVNIRHLFTMSAGALKSSQQLILLLEQLLDITRIHAGKLNLEKQEIDLNTVVQDSVAAVLAEARQVGSEISIDAETQVFGQWDPVRMRQVLYNLLSNAIKYGAGRAIQVSLDVDRNHYRVKLIVRDQGIGIATEMQSKIFERFERGLSSRNISGLGLGLYIVREIVDAHGGKVRVESAPGKGSVFTVELPMYSNSLKSMSASSF